ncbi:hypothetical protein TA3x_002695 [Tundrisphaera sp. TA3]|uniref:hypothetical protein n=1 Tax=Tundrisphaera sp. TA3 TaxID=3435775 RepID=UPI003EB8D959
MAGVEHGDPSADYPSYSVDDCREDFELPGAGVELRTNGLRELAYGAIREGLAVACRKASAEHRHLEPVRAFQVASEDPTLAASRRDRPGAFEAATGARVHPGPWPDEPDQEIEDVYREVVDEIGGSGSDPDESRFPDASRPGGNRSGKAIKTSTRSKLASV